MVRLSETSRDRINALAEQEFPGSTADDVITRLLDEHWERRAVEAVTRYAQEHPEEFEAYVIEADTMDRISGVPVEPWGDGQ
jgi:hypothetical protein